MCGTKIHKFSCSAFQINSPVKSSSNPRMNKQIHQSNKNKSQQKRMLSTLFYLEKIHHCCSLISLWTNNEKETEKLQNKLTYIHNWNCTQHSVEISEYSCHSIFHEINFGNSKVYKKALLLLRLWILILKIAKTSLFN